MSLLADAGAAVAYITSPEAARQAVADIVAGAPDVIGLDFETEVLPEFRQPIPIKFNKDGNLAVRQPRDGAAGARARSLSFQSPARSSLDWWRARLRLRYEKYYILGGHRATVHPAARDLQRGVRS